MQVRHLTGLEPEKVTNFEWCHSQVLLKNQHMEAWSLPPHCTATAKCGGFFLAELMYASKEASRGTGTDQLRGKEAKTKD